MADATPEVRAFFDRYRAALLGRDAKAISGMYAVPALILFPGQSLPVTAASQTERFFDDSWGQYEGVDVADYSLGILEQSDHSVWAEVTWTYNGEPRERFCYQLIASPAGYQIAVLTPLPF
jgi:ketosteroid isomerase-like protein